MSLTRAAFLLGLVGLAAAVPTVSLRVYSDGSGDFSSVQAALDHVSSANPNVHLLLLARGLFWERVNVPANLTALTLVGQGATPLDTLIIYNVSGASVGTFSSWTMRIDNPNATLINVAIANNASNYVHHLAGQSVALDLRGGTADAPQYVRVFNSSLLGAQDTLYTGSENSSSYFYNTYINGSCDALFGESSTVWENCALEHTFTLTAAKSQPLVPGGISGRTAGPGNVSAYLILYSNITVGPGGHYTDNPPSLYLGRPWGPYAQTVIIDSYLGPGVEHALWNDWSHNCTVAPTDWCENVVYATSGIYGPGADGAKPPAWALTLTPSQAAAWTVGSVLRGWNPWLPPPLAWSEKDRPEEAVRW